MMAKCIGSLPPLKTKLLSFGRFLRYTLRPQALPDIPLIRDLCFLPRVGGVNRLKEVRSAGTDKNETLILFMVA